MPVSQDAADIETDIVETPRQVQLDSLRRLAESGRVSATRTDTGDYQIDPAELYRVFPLGTGQGRATEQDATALLAETALLQAQIDNLRQMGELLRNELEHLNSQADRLLLTQSAPAAPAKLAGWLRRLAGQHQSFFIGGNITRRQIPLDREVKSFLPLHSLALPSWDCHRQRPPQNNQASRLANAVLELASSEFAAAQNRSVRNRPSLS